MAHGTSIGKVLVARVVQLGNHLQRQLASLRRKLVLLVAGKDLHNLEQLVRIVVLDIQEIAEAAAYTRIDAEQVFHLCTIACCNDDKLATVVLHTLHQRLQSLRALLVTFATGTERYQRVGLVNKEDTTHSLVAQAVDNLWRLTLIRAHHLRTVNLDHMATIQIADSLHDFTQLTGNGRLTGTRITSQHDVDTSLLLFTQATLCTLHIVVNSKCYLANSLLNLVHTNVMVEIAQDVLQRPFLRYIATDILFLYHRSHRATADKRREDIFGRLDSQMGITKGVVLDFHLVLEEAQKLAFCFW